ncbi:MAG: hypothetical protein PHE68_04625 [Candidatus Peribacteraceae bacterium]|nr:hypothetical protein [Candidatus Peribacteraceae bacterium]
MTLSPYHQQQKALSDEEILKRIAAKEEELQAVLKKEPLHFKTSPIRIAVLGCGDRRYIHLHRVLFEKFLQKPVHVVTFDIVIEHLKSEDGIVQHDCVEPLPGGPFVLVYSHVLLKFIETAKQWDVLFNSYQALSPGGLAVHVMDREEIDDSSSVPSNGFSPVPLSQWRKMLDASAIPHSLIPVKYGQVLVLRQPL